MTRGPGTPARPLSRPFHSLFEPALATSDGVLADHVALVRRRDGSDGPHVGVVVWMRIFANPAAARAFHRWMLRRPERWAVWGRMAPILGPEFLGGQICSEHDADESARREERRRVEARRRRERAVWCRQFEGGFRPAIGLFQGDATTPFWCMRFDQNWERERVWDFVSHRTECYPAWKALFEKHDREMLERTILDEMLRTEREVKKAGLGAGGRRPLRFWRGNAK